MIYYHNIISIYYYMSRLRTKNFISNLKKKKPRVYEAFKRYAEQVGYPTTSKPPIDAPPHQADEVITDSTLLQDGNTELPLSINPPKE